MVCILAQIAIPETSNIAMDYYHGDNILWILQWLLMLAIPFLFLATG